MLRVAETFRGPQAKSGQHVRRQGLQRPPTWAGYLPAVARCQLRLSTKSGYCSMALLALSLLSPPAPGLQSHGDLGRARAVS